MGRGRAKAKQAKVARELKYRTPPTDLDALEHELATKPAGVGYEDDPYRDPHDPYDAYVPVEHDSGERDIGGPDHGDGDAGDGDTGERDAEHAANAGRSSARSDSDGREAADGA